MTTTTPVTTLASDTEDKGDTGLILIGSFAAGMVVVVFGSLIAICKYCQSRTSARGREAVRLAKEKVARRIQKKEDRRLAKEAKKKKEQDKVLVKGLKALGFTYDESITIVAQGNAQFYLDGPPSEFELPLGGMKPSATAHEMDDDEPAASPVVGGAMNVDSWDPFAGLDDNDGAVFTGRQRSAPVNDMESPDDDRVSSSTASEGVDDEPTVICSLAAKRGDQGESDDKDDEEVVREVILDYTESDEDDIYRRHQERRRETRRAPFMLNTRRALPRENPFDTWEQLDGVIATQEQRRADALARRQAALDAERYEEERIRKRISVVAKKPTRMDFEL